MIKIISGQPGNGKSLMALDQARLEYERNAQGVKEGKEQPRRFFTNIDGATVAENPQAFPWMERLPEHNDWTLLPDGSYVVYDEAHADGKTPELARYGLLFPSTGKPGESDDPRIRAMSTHRHRGFDLVMVTQWPSKIHHNIRQLAGEHIHMNRAMGLQRAGVLKWSRVQPDPYDERQREKAEEEIWTFPQDLYGRYKSATLHTASYKFKVPKRIWVALARVVMLVLVGWGLWVWVFKPKPPEGNADTEKGSAAVAQAPAGAGGPRPPVTTMEYIQQRTPRVDAMPWSAPLYDDRKAVSKPKLYCMSASAGTLADGRKGGNSCTCMTEQGTLYKLTAASCFQIARYGPAYDPYQDPTQVAAQASEQPPPAAAAPARSVQQGALISGEQMTAYGDIGVAPPQAIYGSM